MSRSSSMRGAVFADGAATTVPPSPSVGTPYRNPGLTPLQAAQGWPFKTIVDSAPFNEVLYRATSLLNDLEKSGILYWSPYTDYPVGAICRDDVDGNIYNSIRTSGPAAGGLKQPSTQPAYWKLFSMGGGAGGGKNVFEIFYTLSSVVPGGAFDLSLGTLLTGVDTAYPDFWTECVARKNNGTIPTKTETEWQADIAAYGQCGAFVVDTTAKSVRLPKITDFLQGGTLGGVNDAGLPNITGTFYTWATNNSNTLVPPHTSGAFQFTDGGLSGGGTGGNHSGETSFDASRSSSVYGKSSTVQPKSANVKMWIQVVGTAGGGANAQTIVAPTFPNYAGRTAFAANTQYTASQDCYIWVLVRRIANHAGQSANEIVINGTSFTIGGGGYDLNSYGFDNSVMLPLKQGDTYKAIVATDFSATLWVMNCR